LKVELDVEVRAISERLPPSMTGNRRLGHTCHLQGGSTSSTEGVARILCWWDLEEVPYPAAHVTNESEVGEWSAGGRVVEEVG